MPEYISVRWLKLTGTINSECGGTGDEHAFDAHTRCKRTTEKGDYSDSTV